MRIAFSILIITFALSCKKSNQLTPVSVEDFSKFISKTAYVTDAEKYGWSIVQEDVYNFRIDSNSTWQTPNGIDSAKFNYQVTQVSFSDALAYCKWSKTRLPSYDEFWELTKNDKRRINENSKAILPFQETNLIGNVWDLTTTEDFKGYIQLAGGSYLCNPNTCNGTNPNRKLFVDKATGNTHIGFSVIRLKE